MIQFSRSGEEPTSTNEVGREVKGRTHTYYQVLIDSRDCPYIVSLVVLWLLQEGRGSFLLLLFLFVKGKKNVIEKHVFDSHREPSLKLLHF